jgi:epsilon-lactone hydrolase
MTPMHDVHHCQRARRPGMSQTGAMDGDQNVLALPQAPDAIELRHLRAFVAVAEELSFSRAAQRLFISQPALSRQIRGLERLVGCDLFRRSTQRVDLTLAGEALLSRAQSLLSDLDDAISATRSVGGELAGRMALLWEPWVRATDSESDTESVRTAFEELHSRFVPPPDVTIAPATAGGVPALRITPDGPSDGTVLYLHGGGYVAGSAFGYRHLAGAIAVAAGATALVIDYRLAPEHPYPAAVQDAVNAYLWLLDSEAEGGSGAIVIAGDSSAGGLVMSTLLALRDRDSPMPAGAVLMCPWVDLTGRTQRPPQDSPILFSPELARRNAGRYLGGQPGDDPLLTPLRTDLAGLPPMLIQAASGDAVLQEAQLLARHGEECGVDTTITIYPVPTHDFHMFWTFLPEARDAVDEAGRYVRGLVDPGARRAAPGSMTPR